MKSKFLISLAIVSVFILSSPFALAEEGDDGNLLLPDCPTETVQFPDGTTKIIEKCGINELIGSENSLLHNLITFLLLYIAIPLATLSIAIAGFKFILSGSNPGQRESAKKIFWFAFIGLLIAFAAWLIVDTIIEALVEKDNFNPPLNR